MCYLFHAKIKAEGKGGKSSSNSHNAPLVNGNTATELNLVTEALLHDSLLPDLRMHSYHFKLCL